MALTVGSTLSPIVTALGEADAKVQELVDISDTAQMLYKVRVARKAVGVEAQAAADVDFDDMLTLETSLRTLEKALPTTVPPILTSSVTALETYFKAETGLTFRAYWDSKTTDATITWTTAFRTMWRRIKSEELIVKLGDVTKSAGTWPGSLSNTTTITLPSLLEVRAGSLIGASAITVNVTATKADATTDLIALSIPAETEDGTAFSIGGTTKYTGISAITISGGTNADVVEIWIR